MILLFKEVTMKDRLEEMRAAAKHYKEGEEEVELKPLNKKTTGRYLPFNYRYLGPATLKF